MTWSPDCLETNLWLVMIWFTAVLKIAKITGNMTEKHAVDSAEIAI